jgi:hypothetical protein
MVANFQARSTLLARWERTEMGEMVEFGKDLVNWDKQKDTSDAQFIVKVALVLLDKQGNAVHFSGKITSHSTVIKQPTGPILGQDFKCAGSFSVPKLLPGTNFPAPGTGMLVWSCRDSGSKGNIHGPESDNILRYDLSDFQLVDKFLLAKGKEFHKGTAGHATIWFDKTIASKP